jgi:hypothetical protein
MPPSTATLTDSASNSGMASPIDLVLRDSVLTLKWFCFFVLGSLSLLKH